MTSKKSIVFTTLVAAVMASVFSCVIQTASSKIQQVSGDSFRGIHIQLTDTLVYVNDSAIVPTVAVRTMQNVAEPGQHTPLVKYLDSLRLFFGDSAKDAENVKITVDPWTLILTHHNMLCICAEALFSNPQTELWSRHDTVRINLARPRESDSCSNATCKVTDSTIELSLRNRPVSKLSYFCKQRYMTKDWAEGVEIYYDPQSELSIVDPVSGKNLYWYDIRELILYSKTDSAVIHKELVGQLVRLRKQAKGSADNDILRISAAYDRYIDLLIPVYYAARQAGYTRIEEHRWK